MRRAVLLSLVLTVVAACGAEDNGVRKRIDQLERRVEALERGGRRGGAKREGRAEKVAIEAGPKAHVLVTGDATKVALLKNGARHDIPGDVPVGSFQIVARFGDEKVEAGTLEFVADQTVTVACDAATKKCAAQ